MAQKPKLKETNPYEYHRRLKWLFFTLQWFFAILPIAVMLIVYAIQYGQKQSGTSIAIGVVLTAIVGAIVIIKDSRTKNVGSYGISNVVLCFLMFGIFTLLELTATYLKWICLFEGFGQCLSIVFYNCKKRQIELADKEETAEINARALSRHSIGTAISASVEPVE